MVVISGGWFGQGRLTLAGSIPGIRSVSSPSQSTTHLQRRRATRPDVVWPCSLAVELWLMKPRSSEEEAEYLRRLADAHDRSAGKGKTRPVSGAAAKPLGAGSAHEPRPRDRAAAPPVPAKRREQRPRIVPAGAQEIIRQDHKKGLAVLAKYGVPEARREPVEVALAVEDHRWAWKPPSVRLILVAESHVYTSKEDMCLQVDAGKLPLEAQHSPGSFVRLVYCLGYGETSLLAGGCPTSNSGTPQYWQLFGDWAGTLPSRRHVGSMPAAERLRWKVHTLSKLAASGIWLVDASLHAVYYPGGDRLPPDAARGLHRIWVNGYGRSLVEAHRGAAVWCVGKGVHAVTSDLGLRSDGWIYQPQARVTAAQREQRASMLRQVIQGLVSSDPCGAEPRGTPRPETQNTLWGD